MGTASKSEEKSEKMDNFGDKEETRLIRRNLIEKYGYKDKLEQDDAYK